MFTQNYVQFIGFFRIRLEEKVFISVSISTVFTVVYPFFLGYTSMKFMNTYQNFTGNNSVPYCYCVTV